MGIDLDKYDDGKKVRINNGSVASNKVRPEDLLGAQFGGNRERDSQMDKLQPVSISDLLNNNREPPTISPRQKKE